METDTWYQKKLIEDVPEEELHAALIDEDYILKVCCLGCCQRQA